MTKQNKRSVPVSTSRGILIHNSELPHQLLKPHDIRPYNIQTSTPEIRRADIYAKAGGERRGVGQTSRGEQVVVSPLELLSVVLVAGVQPQPEEQAEHVREVVERAPRTVVMPFHRPHVRVQHVLVEPVAIRLLLRVEHQVVELVYRKLSLRPALEDVALENKPAAYVNNNLGAI